MPLHLHAFATINKNTEGFSPLFSTFLLLIFRLCEQMNWALCLKIQYEFWISMGADFCRKNWNFVV
jgi:hypothetical protein